MVLVLSRPVKYILSLALFLGFGFRADIAQEPHGSATGIWGGTLVVGEGKLRLLFHLDPTVGACSLDSLDQGTRGIGCTNLTTAGQDVSFVVPSIHAHFHGTLTPDGKTLEGTWSQGRDLPITLTRQNPLLSYSRGLSCRFLAAPARSSCLFALRGPGYPGHPCHRGPS